MGNTAQELADRTRAAMGPGWKIEGTEHAHLAYLQSTDSDARLVFNLRDGRLRIAGTFPVGADGYRWHPREAHSITVDPGRAPLAMAGEIKRRLLPSYLPAIAEAVERKGDHERAEQRAEDLAKDLAGMLPGGRVSERHGRGWPLRVWSDQRDHLGHLDVTVDTCAAEITLRTGDQDLTRAVVRFIAEYGK